MIKHGVIRRYREFLPLIAEKHVVTLGEGDTPLIRAFNIERIINSTGAKFKVYLKLEGFNPTGSFKDRGMTMAISYAKAKGVKKVICASTGNTASSAAAYTSRAGMECEVYLPKGKVAAGKIAQVGLYGAKLIEIDGNFDAAFNQVQEMVARDPSLELVNSTHPYRLEGQKTAAFEICDDLYALTGKLYTGPDYHCIPVGNGGNITAYWRGYQQYLKQGNQLPRMLGFQAEGAAPLVTGQKVDNPETVASAIRIGNPVHWQNALNAAKDSGGGIFSVSDKMILAIYAVLAKQEQVFCEPASAASVAGLIKLVLSETLQFKPGSTFVCTLTGHGLKDPDIAASLSKVNTSKSSRVDYV